MQNIVPIKSVLVSVNLTKFKETAHQGEFHHLVISAGMAIVAAMTCRRESPDPKYFIGQGKIRELQSQVLQHNADLVVFDHTLTPVQEKNLEQFLHCKVLDYTSLILNIFAQRAHSFEGKLQVELARLEHMATRLVRGWTHLERQRGGIGLRGGPGETQLESDRRVLRQKVSNLRRRLAKLEKQRKQNRRARQRSKLPVVACVGYTNAGKSTLFNQLVSGNSQVANQLFTTLDPTLRRVYLPNFGTIIFADTVGFIRDLPHELVAAFHATLEETREADLLLHIIDANDEQKKQKIEVVNGVLQEIGADQVPQLEVLNKIDLLEDFEPRIDYSVNNLPTRVWISAARNTGTTFLFDAIKMIIT